MICPYCGNKTRIRIPDEKPVYGSPLEQTCDICGSTFMIIVRPRTRQLDADVREKIKGNNAEISRLMKENEDLLRDNGFDPPSRNVAIHNDFRIKVPKQYIRKASYFIERYHLTEIVGDNDVSRNIAYAFQLSDFYNYLFNRFHIWGAVETTICKQDFVNLVSIMEALILECGTRLKDYCKLCSCTGGCPRKLVRNDCRTARICLKKMGENGYISLTGNNIKRLDELFQIRNGIHIRESGGDVSDKVFDIELHNESIGWLRILAEDLMANAVPCYDTCVMQRDNMKQEDQ